MNAPEHKPILDVATHDGISAAAGSTAARSGDRRRGGGAAGHATARRASALDDFKQLTRSGLRHGDDELSRRGCRCGHVAADHRNARVRHRSDRVTAVHAVLAHHFSRQRDPAHHLVARDQGAGGAARPDARGGSSRLRASRSCCCASPVHAHPAPFSYLDLRLSAGGVTGTLVVHDLDAAHDLGLTQADSLLDPAMAASIAMRWWRCWRRESRCSSTGGRSTITWGGIDVVPERQSVRLAFTVTEPSPGHVAIRRLRLSVRSDPPDLHQPLRRRRDPAPGDPRCVASRPSSTTPAPRRAASR